MTHKKKVSTVRSGEPLVAYLRGVRKGKQPYPDLVVLSPGPGNPGDFGLSDTIREVNPENCVSVPVHILRIKSP